MSDTTPPSSPHRRRTRSRNQVPQGQSSRAHPLGPRRRRRSPAEQYRERETIRREGNSCVRNSAGDLVELLTGRRCGLGRKTRGKRKKKKRKKETKRKRRKKGTRKKKAKKKGKKKSKTKKRHKR